MKKLGALLLCFGLLACNSSPNTNDSPALATVSSTSFGLNTEAAANCQTLATQQGRVACAANAVLATLSATQLSSVNLKLTDYTNRTKWNNLPVAMKPRAGVQMGSL